MSSKEAHTQSCEQALGKGYPEVHAFLDRYARRFPHIHRKLYHHRQGIRLIVEKFGPDAAQAAERHVTEDEGFIPDKHTHYKTDNPELLALVESLYPASKA